MLKEYKEDINQEKELANWALIWTATKMLKEDKEDINH